MSLSVVVRTRNEADRLRLTLASLAVQTAQSEVVVVNDGSSDHTYDVIEDAVRSSGVKAVHIEAPKGRSGAANAGARAARSEFLLFLDGDTLAGPDLVRRHMEVHARSPKSVARGELLHLRGTRFLRDPELCTPQLNATDKVDRLSRAERDRLRITRSEIACNFPTIHDRAEFGLYPGVAPRMLQNLELQAIRQSPLCSVNWAAASGSNQSVPREAFLALGGFNESLDINEHRELALRLCKFGLKMTVAEGARSYHMTHRSGWRDPLEDHGWELAFYGLHPIPEVKLLSVLWASLAPNRRVPQRFRIDSLPALESAARLLSGKEIDNVRAALGLVALN